MGPEYRDKIGRTDIRDIVDIKRRHIYILRVRAADPEFHDLSGKQLAQAYYRLTARDQESLELTGVIVVTARDPGFCGREKHLPRITGFDRLKQRATVVLVDSQSDRIVIWKKIGTKGIKQAKI